MSKKPKFKKVTIPVGKRCLYCRGTGLKRAYDPTRTDDCTCYYCAGTGYDGTRS